MDIKKLLKDKSVINLDIGGGMAPQKGFITLYDQKLDGVDIVWDYNKLPYPFPDESVDFIKCVNVAEKINRIDKGFIKWMDGLWRILKYDCELAIATVYGGSYLYYQDPTNVNPLNEATFCYFDPLDKSTNGILYKLYKPKPWAITTMTFQVSGIMELLLTKRRIDYSYEN